MSSPSLIGRILKIMPSDPWDLVGTLGELPFPGCVVLEGTEPTRYSKEGKSAILMELPAPLELAGVAYRWIQASARYEGEAVHDLKKAGDRLTVALTCIPNEKYKGGSLDTSWWRGGAAFIGTIELT